MLNHWLGRRCIEVAPLGAAQIDRAASPPSERKLSALRGLLSRLGAGE